MNERRLRAMLAPLQRRVAMLAARAVLKLVKDDPSRQQLQVEILKDELRDDVERAQNYGFTSHPHPGADAFLLSLAGARGQAVAIVVDDRRYRVASLQEGEVAFYDDLGNRVMLLRDKMHVVAVQELFVEAPTVQVQATIVTIDATSTTLNSDLAVNGDTTFTGSVTANGKPIDDTHEHDGVSPGSGTSGAVH